MIENNLSVIPTELIRSTLCKFIENKLKSKSYRIDVSSASQAGEGNFVGVVHRVSFNKSDEPTSEKNPEYKLILKVAPQSESRRDQFFSRDLFIREIYMYDVVLPQFRQFEQSKGLKVEENGFTEYPKCYRTIEAAPSESVLLEDMGVRGFTIIDRFTEEITADHVRLVMQALGKFHAVSFAMKDQKPEKFNKLSSQLTELFIRKDVNMIRNHFNEVANSVFDVISEEEDALLYTKLKNLLEKDAIDIAADCLDLKSTGSATVIAHGDTWQNNTMFKYDENEKPIEICLLDWQVTRQASPIIDITYYMFCCTTKELRDAHYDEFLKVYHKSLSTHILRLGSNPEQLFPYKLMLEHFRKFAKFGLILATVLLPMLTAERGNTLDLDDIANKIKNGEKLDPDSYNSGKTAKYQKRLRGVVLDMMRLKYI